MNRRTIEDAVKAVTGIMPGSSATGVTVPIRLDQDGIHYQQATATHADWTFTGQAWTDEKSLLKLLRQSGKPGDTVTLVQGSHEGQVKAGGVTLPEIEADNRDLTTRGTEPQDGYLYDLEALAAVAIGASTDDMRPVLTSIHLGPDAVVSTDSYRLFYDQGQDQPGMVEDGFNLPAAIVKAAASRKGEMFTFQPGPAVDKASISFDTGTGWTISATVHLTVGPFPKYRQLIPEDQAFTSTATVAGATDPVKKVAGWLEKNRPAVLAFNEREITVSTPEGNPTTVDPVGIARIVGNCEEMRIGINPEFFLSGIEYAGEHAELGAISPLRPIHLAGQNGRNALLMPIRLND